jgi:hypothetical protein
MFIACFDAGGSQHDQNFLVVAGFISSADTWKRFDTAWRERLEQDDLSYFHMVDLAQSTEEFKEGWKNNEPRRQKLLADLMEIIQKYAFRRFGCAVNNELFLLHLSKERREEYFLDAYALAGMDCTAQVLRWCKTQPAPEFHTVRFVFEDGDLGKGKLIKRFSNDLDMTPFFEPKQDKLTEHGKIAAFTPLQAADFLSYEILKGCKEMINRKHNPRWGLEQFIQMPGELGIYDQENIEALDMNHQVAKATLEWFKNIYGKKS